ncbi:CtsR family transcriptional regulator [Thermohalobacter berrensis]|uniref:Transcriptional regulator CtsR n=1 Tax=Thermohalobacter berrensis TaxID=99594 RepID=A0A419T841_9FIRM|nr:CtsR family transcriptional regulator [Thermohalobacter berrensis]RKD33757.1 CtsR family transcriptional regulator [Thermohalobacter berrensis]
MARLSDVIEDFIKSLMQGEKNKVIEIQRNELAEHFNCAPSQINYVLTTRFTIDKGYYIESKRGGGGYIKIKKVNIKSDRDIYNLILNKIGNSITKMKAYSIIDNFLEKGFISRREAALMKASLNERSLNSASQYKNELRASIIKEMLLALLRE